MTDHNDSSKRRDNKTLNLQDIENAIIEGKKERLKALIANDLFDELQKSYLIKLAKEHKQPDIESLLKELPATP
ncbi:hypothetical protein KJ365_00315 [Glaciecola sp. XM2]|jgi:hypothetical protein|uniref:hypothetical protein n=1 Tax=Glaciecola sp. XM2 TaxID=1914931 RepID=UPI001BDF540A|nr:hypothetical protein [Glaciecola sp. XM2]MBT1449308.1 hypothetical protein [Glaciecola sp. XM2]